MPDRSEAITAAIIEAYDRLIATVEGAARQGASMPYTSVNGNMSSFLSPTGHLALRLSAAVRATLIDRYGATPHEAHGRVMAEYVTVPAPLLDDTTALAPWFAASWTYVSSLKPKPTTRRRA